MAKDRMAVLETVGKAIADGDVDPTGGRPRPRPGVALATGHAGELDYLGV